MKTVISIFYYKKLFNLKSRNKIVFLFSIILICSIGATYYFSFEYADSDDSSISNSKYTVTATTITDFVPSNYFPSLSEDSPFKDFESLLQMTNSETELFQYSDNGEQSYGLFKQLPTFGWILVYEKPM